MAERLDHLVERVRAAKGPFFVARVALRLSFPLGKGEALDTPEREEELMRACRELGFELTPADDQSAEVGLL